MNIEIFIILVCIITTCIDLLIKILVASVMYVIQFSLGVLQTLVQEFQDLFTLTEAVFVMTNKQFQIIIGAMDTAVYVSISDISDFVFLTDV